MNQTLSFEAQKRSFFNTAVADAYRAADGGSLVGAIILSFCLIDYGASILYGQKKNRYNKWIKTYLVPHNQRYDLDEAQKALWKVRNSLIHSYGNVNRNNLFLESGFLLTHAPTNHDHLGMGWGGKFTISLYYLLPEVTMGLWDMFEDIQDKEGASERLSELIQIIGRSEDWKAKKYSSMHKALESMDEVSPSVHTIQSRFDVLLDKPGDY